MGPLRRLRDKIRRDLRYYRAIMCHDETPAITRILHVIAIVYLLIPIDVIPDWVSILGYIDDVILVSLMIFLAVSMVPEDVAEECESELWEGEWADQEWEEIFDDEKEKTA